MAASLLLLLLLAATAAALRECRAKSANFLSIYLSSSNCERLVAADVDLRALSLEEARELASVLAGNGDVRVLELFRARLSAEAACAIGEALQRGSMVSELDLGHADVGGLEGLRCIFRGAAQSPHLRKLSLLGMEMGDDGMDAFRDAFQGRQSGIETLNLGGNGLGASVPRSLAPAIRAFSQLRVLDLSNNPLGPHGLAPLAAAVKDTLGHLDTLLLQSVKLSFVSLRPLLDLLGGSVPPLTKLSLARNADIGGTGAEELAQRLRSNKQLLHLDLSMTGAGDRGARVLAGWLSDSPPLTRILLSMNDITDEGGAALAQALSTNRNLQGMDLSYNLLSDETAMELLQVLKTHRISHIEFLGLQRNAIKAALLDQLAAHVRQAADAGPRPPGEADTAVGVGERAQQDGTAANVVMGGIPAPRVESQPREDMAGVPPTGTADTLPATTSEAGYCDRSGCHGVGAGELTEAAALRKHEKVRRDGGKCA
jgi:Ran GTPase-activating protein (RanGAP) involved in mRNA processing and transport